MKKLILSFLLAGLTAGVYGQSQAEVEKLLSEYQKAMQAKEWLKSLDYVYPAMFDVIPREMMEETLAQTFNSPELEIAFEEMELLQVSDIYSEDNITYSFADYTLVMSMQLAGDKTEEQTQQFAEIMASQVGEENVSVDGKVVYITQTNKLAAIKNKGEEKIYLLELNPQLKEIMASFMSETFLDRAFAES